MTILFPSHPLKPRQPDPDYREEFDAATRAGFRCEVFDLEKLRKGDTEGSLSVCSPPETPDETLVHRGWMMNDTLYGGLHRTLVAKGYRPITSPAQYAEAHYLPNAYERLRGLTPESRWMTGADLDEAWALYQSFRDGDAILKDFVKSAKHRWREACFLPSNTSRERFEEIFRAFLQARGHLFERGIVIRKFHPLVELQRDLRGQPVHEEYRLFFWSHRLLAATPPLRGSGPSDDPDRWEAVAAKFDNPFICMDIARQMDGSWLIIEAGDGGVSGLPPVIDMDFFYTGLHARITKGA